MSEVLVSVVMITYGQERYIAQAIEGVLMQETNFPIELIIGDDHLQNDAELIVKDLINNHPRGHIIKYTRHTKNKGIVNNLIWTMQQCKGKYLAICEGDDYWTDPLKLQKQADYLEANPSIVFCFHAASTIDEKGMRGVYYKSKYFKDKEVVPKKHFIAKGGGGFATASSMFKQSIIEDLPNYFRESSVGDLPLALLAISKGDIGYLGDDMCDYRVMSEGSWSKETKIEGKIKNNLNCRKTVEVFNKHNKYKFEGLSKVYIKNNIFYLGIYRSNKSVYKTIVFLMSGGYKMGITNMLRLFKFVITK